MPVCVCVCQSVCVLGVATCGLQLKSAKLALSSFTLKAVQMSVSACVEVKVVFTESLHHHHRHPHQRGVGERRQDAATTRDAVSSPPHRAPRLEKDKGDEEVLVVL